MLRGIDDDEKLVSTILGAGQNRQIEFAFTENGLYEVLMQSRKRDCQTVQEREVKEILKTIRKHGICAYGQCY